jgi:nucleotide-binding universal stress UspA family protein
MFRRVLFPTDFSDCSYKALECLRHMRGAGVEEVTVVSVLDERDTDLVTTGIGWLSGDRMVEYDAGIEKRMRENVQERLDGMAGVLRGAGMKVRTAIEKGVPSVEILAIAKRERASLIVMGSHGKSNLAGVVVGSVSEEVLRRSSVPVLIIPREMQGGCRGEGEE